MDYKLLATRPVPPDEWGPHYWYVIHTYAEVYPENPDALDKEVAGNFIKSIPFILPCAECSKHAFEYIKKNYANLETVLENRTALVHFFRKFHDNVNKTIGKPQLYKEYLDEITKKRIINDT